MPLTLTSVAYGPLSGMSSLGGSLMLRGPQITFDEPNDQGVVLPGLSPETEAAPEPAAPEPTEAESAAALDSSLTDIFKFDPFGPAEPSEPKAPLGTAVPVTPPPMSATPPPAAGPEGAQPSEPAPQAVDPAVAAMMARQTEILERITTPPPAPAAEPEGDAPFAMQLPMDLVAAVRSEDPAEVNHALNHIVNGVATAAYTRAKTELTSAFNQKLASLEERLPKLMTSHVEQAQTQQQAKEVFYKAYPALANPMLGPVVRQAALDEGQAWQSSGKPFTGMTPEFAQAIAARIAGALNLPVEALAAKAPEAVQTPAPAPRVPFAPSGGGVRPSPQPSAEQKFAAVGLDHLF